MELTAPRVAGAHALRERARWGMLWLLALPILLIIVLPLAALVARVRPPWLIENLSSPQAVQAISLSLVTSTASTGIALLFGTPLAYLLARRNCSNVTGPA